jgi:hypothetical protein
MTGGGLGQASAQSRATDESALKAAFVYNFAKYTDWPDDVWNKSPKLRLCMAGERGGFTQTVAALEGKPAVRGKEVEVRQLSRPEEAASCHILVIAGRAKMAEWTRGVRFVAGAHGRRRRRICDERGPHRLVRRRRKTQV